MEKYPSRDKLSHVKRSDDSKDKKANNAPEGEPDRFVVYPPLFSTSEEKLAALRKAWDDHLEENSAPEFHFDSTWVTGKEFGRARIHGFQGPSHNYPDTSELAWLDGREAFFKWLKVRRSLLKYLDLDPVQMDQIKPTAAEHRE
jgi:hypothetical protein